MEDSDASGSPRESIETPRSSSHGQVSDVTEAQWKSMKQILDKIYRYRDPDGHDPSKPFQRKVNKRSLPDYYNVIKEPVALSTLKGKHLHKSYATFAGFVRDAALITHNAQTYNRPEAGAYQDSILLRGIFQKELQTLVDQSIISPEAAKYPDLGELPPVEDLPPPLEEEEEDDEEEDEDEEDDDEDEEDDTDDDRKRKRKRGPRSTAVVSKREGGGKGDSGQKSSDDPRKRRGRPPKVDTPMEARIKAILKAVRKFKNDNGHLVIHQFEKLPDKAELPDYYIEIKEPLAVEQIKRKQKRKKYQSVDHFLHDMDVMFNNCKAYNTEASQIYQDAASLQFETHRLADEEKAKPDSDYALEEGRLPLPNGILHNGETWKIGDWVHIQNANDVTKPIVAQIYRTWQDTDGEKWINACWYYRPEQTVHQYEKHFLPDEVVKTGQYRDHRIDEIIDRCFVMFITRYSKGRPRGLSANKEVYVCDSRYNEEKHRLNKIKTWASCLPDEVRDKDYEMDLFDHPKKAKKVPSPILHLLKEDAKENEEMPKPRWGVENAPPIVGAVYKGPRDENQSPPPEPTPSPPPQPPPSTLKPVHTMSNYDMGDYRRNDVADGSIRTSSHADPAQSYTSSQLPQYNQRTASPASIRHPQQITQQVPNAYAQPGDHYNTPTGRFAPPLRAGTGNAVYPRPQEVYRLPENANLAIPDDVRRQFQQDENGHVLFFTIPPVDTLMPVRPGSAIGHTAKYLAAKLRDETSTREKRKADGFPEDSTEDEQLAIKRSRREVYRPPNDRVKDSQEQALNLWIKQMQQGTERIYQDLYGRHWEESKQYDEAKLGEHQAAFRKRNLDLETSEKRRMEKAKVDLLGLGIFKDDLNPRL